MNPRQLILLSPYRLPTETTLYMSDEEVGAILNGFQALWHPAVLALGSTLPRIAQPYDHEEPQPDSIYAVPDNPPLMLPEDWGERARTAGAVVFTASHNRQDTLDSLLEQLRPACGDDAELLKLLDLPADRVRPFLGIGFGYAVVEALFEAMSHDNTVPVEEIHQDLRLALESIHNEDPESWRQHLQSAADRLLSAREVLYPVTLYLVDLVLQESDQPAEGWLRAAGQGLPVNLIACGELLERTSQAAPERFSELRDRVGGDLVEVLGGPYRETEDPLLPLESQMWNLLKGQAVYQELLGTQVRVFARKRFGFHAQSPLFLQNAGFTHALHVVFDDGQIPSHRSVVVSWPSHDGKQVECFTRTPQAADSPQTYFHLAHYLHETIMQDQAATFVLMHRGTSSCPWYEDWLELTRFAPVLGRWVTLSGYFSEVVTGDYSGSVAPDEFQIDYLSDRTLTEGPGKTRPISAFAEQIRTRRKVDAAWTFTSILRSLGGRVEDVEETDFLAHLAGIEDRFESGKSEDQAAVEEAHQRAADALAQRLVSRGQADSPGWLVLNPCGFTRRIALELPGIQRPIPAGGPVKAFQMEADLAKIVVEVPPLGFAWVPKHPPEGPAIPSRMRLADEHAVRNEFLEAEIDPQTGGLRGIRDQRYRIGRLGQQLVYNPGSSMRATKIEVISSGPALGEVVSEGVLLDDSGSEIAGFRQRFRVWLGRPMLDLHIELTPRNPVEGYAWHSYFGSRFAWREEMATLVRSCSGLRSIAVQNRPETPDYLELRVGRNNTVIFPGGLPFHQRHGSRMLDVLLICEGEQQTSFEMGISLEREQPMQTSLGYVSPVAVIPTTKGPPHVGATGWLYHLDATNLMLSSLRPALDHPDAILATMLECTGAGGPAQFRCARDPVRAVIQDLQGNPMIDAMLQGDAVDFEVSANDLLQLRMEFS